jgi:UDP-N-acetylmuramoylalanine--D-glutamate ligase
LEKVRKKGRPRKDEKPDNTERVSMTIYEFASAGKPRFNLAAGVVQTAVALRKNKIRDAFKLSDHLIDRVATVGGVEFYNNSKATNVNATWFALECLEKKIVLILGGVDKANDYSSLQDLVKEKVRAIVCLGKDNRKIHAAFKSIVTIIDTTTAVEAVAEAFDLAQKGDAVLLSPACASFDLFKNYEDRGNKFIAAVKQL